MGVKQAGVAASWMRSSESTPHHFLTWFHKTGIVRSFPGYALGMLFKREIKKKKKKPTRTAIGTRIAVKFKFPRFWFQESRLQCPVRNFNAHHRSDVQG